MIKTLALENFLSPVFSKTSVRTAGKSKSHGLRFWMSVGLIALNGLLLMSYVYGVNKYASVGYEIKSLQNKLSVLSEDNKKINFKVSTASSMVSIQNDFLSANYVLAGTPRFIQVNSNQFTQR